MNERDVGRCQRRLLILCRGAYLIEVYQSVRSGRRLIPLACPKVGSVCPQLETGGKVEH